MLAMWAAESAVLPVVAPLIIGALTLVGFAAQFQQQLRYRRESALIKTAARLELEYAVPVARLELPLPTDSETHRRVQTIYHLAGAGQLPRTSDLGAATVLRDEAAPSSRISRFLLSSLLILGLLGTLTAFRGVLGEPPGGDEQGRIDAAKLDAYVRGVYAGLGGAFYASMAGVGGTVFLLISRAIFVTGARSRFLAELDALTEEHLIPRLYRAPPTTPQALSEASNRMRSVTQDLAELGKGLREALIGAQASVTNLERFSGALRDGAQSLNATFATGGTAERQFASLSASLSRQEAILEESTAEAGADRATLREALGKLTKLGDAVVLWQHAAGGLLEQFSTSQEKQRVFSQEATQSLSASAAKMAESATEQHRQRQSEHATLIQEITRVFGRFEPVTREMSNFTGALHKASDRHFEMIASFGQKVAAAAESQNASLRAVAETVQLEPVARDLATLAAALQTASDRHFEMIASLGEKLAAAVESQSAGLQAVVEAVRETGRIAVDASLVPDAQQRIAGPGDSQDQIAVDASLVPDAPPLPMPPSAWKVRSWWDR